MNEALTDGTVTFTNMFSATGYMLDTNVFSNLMAGKIHSDELPLDGQCWATNVQLEELKNASNHTLRSELLSIFKEVITDQSRLIPAAFAWNVAGAGFGEGEWRSNGAFWQLLKDNLDIEWDKLPNWQKKRSKKSNNIPDASIAEAAFHNGFILVTCDGPLATVAERHGIPVLRIDVRGTSIG